MDIDIYQTCPCHTEKKIKFCCGKEIVADLNKILTLNKSKQLNAALENLDRAIDRLGPRDCLLTIKTHLLISLHRYDDAWQVNDQFLAAHPNHPVGHQHRAILLATQADSTGAVDALQNALDAAPVNEVPVSMANALRVVGMLLMSKGDVVASRAHLMLSSQLRGEDDPTAARLIMQMYRAPEIPIQLKHDLSVQSDSPDGPWRRLLDNARRFAVRGRWREALRRAEALEKDYPGVPEIVQAVAVWSSKIGFREPASQAFARLASIESLSFEDRIDAQTLALLTDDRTLTQSLDIVRVVYRVDDEASLVEQATASPRMIAGTINSEMFIGEGPPPTAAFLLLDRDEIKTGADWSHDQIPAILAETLVFGRQTDRGARCEMIATRSDQFEHIKHEMKRVLGPCLGELEDEEVVDEVSMLDHMMSFQWHLPREMSIQARRAFVSNKRRNEIMNVWTTIPFNPLNGQTPDEAKDDPEHRLALAALVSIMEQGADAQINTEFNFDELRQKLGLPATRTLDPADIDVSQISPVQMQQLDFEKMDDEPLMHSYFTCMTMGNLRALRICARVVLQRPHLDGMVQFESVLMTLAKLTMDTDEALGMMQKARQHASSAGRPVGHLLVDELDIRLERGLVESCGDLLRTIQTNHLSDPQVQYHLAHVLQRFGIMDAEGRIVADLPEEAPPAMADAPGQAAIWTPDGQPAEGPVESGTGQKSKLWLPE